MLSQSANFRLTDAETLRAHCQLLVVVAVVLTEYVLLLGELVALL